MIKLIVDSTFGLEKEFIEKYDVQVVSLQLLLDDENFVENTPETWGDFFEKLEKSTSFPKTSQPSPENFVLAANKIWGRNPEAEIIILTLSQTLSGTINAATIAANSFKGKKIIALDSRQAAVGARVLLEAVLAEIESGKTFDEVVRFVDEVQDRIDLLFVPSTMEYLKRGGRIGKLSATIASVLSIKPIFSFKNGMVTISKKVLGLSKALNDMILSLPKQLEKVYVCYIHNNQYVQQLIEKVKALLQVKNIEIMPVSPVFGAHIGIGAIGLATLATK